MSDPNQPYGAVPPNQPQGQPHGQPQGQPPAFPPPGFPPPGAGYPPPGTPAPGSSTGKGAGNTVLVALLVLGLLALAGVVAGLVLVTR
ncbi:hypothetical protein [Nocardioides sp. J54]|uniref:hypothetical protein n=1 Tax=Nocardioides sp. J54 TaxID=935866 RepID=UPI0004BB385C|nr:hypothetical protein [Nocardioides sp. J54]